MNNITLTPEQKIQFDQNGYIILENIVTREDIENGRTDFERIVEKANSRTYLHVRDDHQLIKNGFYGIELPFHPEIYSEPIFKAVVNSKILDYCNSALETNDTFLAVSRFHTSFGYTWSGHWHRDNEVNAIDHVQVIFPFYDELGLHIVPGSHKVNIEGFTPGKKTRRKFPGEIVINLKASNVLLFNSAILHRGTCSGGFNGMRRAHMHLRIAKIGYLANFKRFDEYHFWNNANVLKIADSTWHKLLTQKLAKSIEFSPYITGHVKTGFIYKCKSLLNRIVYYLLKNLPEQHFLFENFNSLRPYLTKNKIVKEYKIYPSLSEN